jgi:hypothetical protein
MSKTIINIFTGEQGRKKHRPVALFLLFPEIKIGANKSMVTLAEGQKVKFTLVALDSKGRPAQIDGVPVWTNSNENAVTLTLNEDQISGEIVFVDGGVAQIKAEVDVRLGPDVKLLTALADVTCLPLEASVVELQLGVPEAA